MCENQKSNKSGQDDNGYYYNSKTCINKEDEKIKVWIAYVKRPT